MSQPPLSELGTLLLDSPELLLQDDGRVKAASLKATKYLFDQAIRTESQALSRINDLLKELAPSKAPQTRSQAQKAQKDRVPPNLLRPTPLTTLHVEGLDEQQIWGQLDLHAEGLCSVISSIMNGSNARPKPSNDEDDEMEGIEGMDEDDDEDDFELDEDMAMFDAEADSEESSEDSQEDEEDEDDDESSLSDEQEGSLQDSDQDALEDEDEEERSLFDSDSRPTKSRKKFTSPLDDGFFSLQDFNAETEEGESRKASRGNLNEEEDDEDEESVDLFASVENEGVDFEEEDVEDTPAGQAKYSDFFAPPPKKGRPGKGGPSGPAKQGKVKFNETVRVKKISANNNGVSAKDLKKKSLSQLWDMGEEVEDDESDDDLEEDEDEDDEDDESESDSEGEEDDEQLPKETIDRFKNDLFEEDEEEEENAREKSAHELRQEAIAKQIAELETENVGAKDWTLMGEATSRKRPHNSLLEEDLEFEHTQRPVATTSASQIADLEALIKQRIMEKRFDDVQKKRPLNDQPFLPSKMFELNDAKATQSLAQIYEEDYVSAKEGGGTHEKDAKLQKAHEELEGLWDRICSKLDALSNSHFTPKTPKATISSVSNVASASLESALPTSTSTKTALAPEEVFATNSTDFRARSELTPSEKKAQRARERKARKKVQVRLAQTSAQPREGKKSGRMSKEEKDQALKVLLKTSQAQGVTVKAGNKPEKEPTAKATGGSFRL